MKKLFLLPLLFLAALSWGQMNSYSTASLSAACTNATSTCGSIANSQALVSSVGFNVASVTAHGSYTGVTLNFDISDDGGVTWYPDTCTRGDTPIQEVSEAVTNNATRQWDCGVSGTSNFRVRANAISTGAVIVGVTLSVSNIEPAPTVSISGSFTTTLGAGSSIIGKVGIDQTTPGTTNAISATNLPTTVDTNTGTSGPSTLRVAQGSGPWTSTIQQGGNSATVSAGGALKVDGSAVTQPVSGTITSNAGTGNFTVVQSTGTNLHAVLDTTSTTAVTQATGSNLHAQLDSGSTTAVTQATGTNLHTVIDSGAVTNTPPANQSVNHTQTAGSTLGAIANYGTSPGAVAVESVNAFITNTPSVTIGANSSVNVAQVAGTTTSVNSGTVDAGTQRHVLATNIGIPLGAATVGQSSGNGAMAANDTAGVARVFAEAPFVWDGANNKQVTSASLANEAPSSGAFTPPTGLQMVEKGPRWAINNSGATSGAQGTASIAAAASKRHVIDCIGFSADSAAAVVATNVQLNVRDGATGAGTVIWFYALSFPTASALGIQEISPQHFCGLNLIGTTNTAMTIEFSAGVTGSIQAVNASGYDIN